MPSVTLETKEFLLPFSVLSENRQEPFTSDLEVAAAFALAELDRTKGGGLILRQPEEKLVFLAKIGYPLWLFPMGEKSLIFDGLSRASYTLPYGEIPDVRVFLDNLKRASKTLETHVAFLADHLNYFQAPVTEKGLLIKGLITNPEFLGEFEVYQREATEIVDQPAHMALLNPVLDESTMAAAVHDLDRLYKSFKEEAERLNQSMRLLTKVTNNYIKEIRDKANVERAEFDAKIKDIEEMITPKADRIKDDYDEQIIALTKNFDKERLPAQKEKVKLEKSREQLLTKIENYKLEAKSAAEADDSVREKKWKEKVNEAKKELSDIEDKLKENEKTLKDMEERQSLEVFKLRSELEAKIKELRQPLLELEASRDAKILIHRQAIDKLEKQTKLISDQLGRIAKLREANIAQFEALGVKRESEFKEIGLFYVPFYLTCYQVESKKRYSVLPPSMANPIGFSTKLKGALGRSKIKGLLAPRFETIASLEDTIQVLIQQNAVFDAEIKEKGAKNHMLSVDAVRESIKKGLLELKNEGWLSDREYDALSRQIASA
ncbi:MAG: hypothetical protein NWE99_06925 [Candidatus Bathyarchaeota archaeon]|nr:hypothetical protein [Candidatus Bathyarchaeota archaeon]